MPPPPTMARGLSEPQRADAASGALRALDAGELVVLPTETVYGVFAAASLPAAVDRLVALARGRPGPWAWHAPSAQRVLEAITLHHAAHRRLFARLAPGPVTFLIERTPQELEAIRRHLRVAPQVIDNGREVLVRITDHDLTRGVLAAAAHSVVAEGLSAVGWGGGVEPGPAHAAVGKSIAMVVDEGPTRLAKPSTTLRLRAAGSFEVVSKGAVEERFIRKQLERTILFVCSGNTCRSPMAEAIARHLAGPGAAGGEDNGIITRIKSAGTSATAGTPATPESIKALKSLSIPLWPGGQHQSRELTRDLVGEADAIFTMTAAHRRAVLAADPTAATKTHLLDPDGGDVQDPIGQPQEVYTATAEQLRELIQARLRELAP